AAGLDRAPSSRVVLYPDEEAAPWTRASKSQKLGETAASLRRPRHRRHGVSATPNGDDPTAMSLGFLVLDLTSIVDTELGLPEWATKAVLPSGVTTSAAGVVSRAMAVGLGIRVFTSKVDTVPLRWVTKAVLPSGVSTTEPGSGPTAMSLRFLVLVFTSMTDTVPLP